MSRFRSQLINYLVKGSSWCFLMLMLVLTGCGSIGSAPVTERWLTTKDSHQVQPGETLYAIAWRHGRDYRQIARLNHIPAPYKVYVGQRLLLKPGTSYKTPAQITVAAKPVIMSAPKPVIPALAVLPATPQPVKTMALVKPLTPIAPSKPPVKPMEQIPAVIKQPVATAFTSSQWLWPVKGKVISGYGANKGIDIAAAPGTPVYAAGSGKVVYAGSGLRGYGELIIIKHNADFLSAYAHNSKLLVHEGATIKAGQSIAEVGDTDAKQPMLHFEIRRAGKPVDPMQFLPKK